MRESDLHGQPKLEAKHTSLQSCPCMPIAVYCTLVTDGNGNDNGNGNANE